MFVTCDVSQLEMSPLKSLPPQKPWLFQSSSYPLISVTKLTSQFGIVPYSFPEAQFVHSPVAGASAKHAATNACQLSDGTGVTAKTASMNTFETVSNNSDKERDVRKNLPRRFEKAMISILFSAFNLCTTRRINLLKHQHQTRVLLFSLFACFSRIPTRVQSVPSRSFASSLFAGRRDRLVEIYSLIVRAGFK